MFGAIKVLGDPFHDETVNHQYHQKAPSLG